MMLTDTKHPAEVLAETDPRQYGPDDSGDPGYIRELNWQDAVIEQLRRIPALEAERGVLMSSVEQWQKLAESQSNRLAELEADRSRYMAQRDRAEAHAILLRFEINRLRAALDDTQAEASVAQAAAERVPLTDEQMREALRQCPHDTVANLRVRWLYAKDFARAIEHAHGIGSKS